MNLRRPWVFLLAGVLAGSGSGCATYTALTSASPSVSGSKASAERLASIGRTFENQGRYDQAEVMYRKALRVLPADETIQSQLQQLADRRAGREFGPDPMARAIAMADAVSGSSAGAAGKSRVAPDQAANLAAIRTVSQVTEYPSNENELELDASAVAVTARETAGTASMHPVDADADLIVWEDIAPVPPQAVMPQTSGESSSVAEASSSPELLEEAGGDGPEIFADILPADSSPSADANGQQKSVSVEDLLLASEDLDGNVDLVIAGLEQAGDDEARTLAAALLGDCQAKPEDISRALSNAFATEKHEGVLLAIADSQVQRGIADEATVTVLLELASSDGSVFQIQAVSSLRYFAASPSADVCQQELSELLTNTSQQVRAAAVLTLGDFEESGVTLSALQQLATEDIDMGVREAAQAAIQRRQEQKDAVGRTSL